MSAKSGKFSRIWTFLRIACKTLTILILHVNRHHASFQLYEPGCGSCWTWFLQLYQMISPPRAWHWFNNLHKTLFLRLQRHQTSWKLHRMSIRSTNNCLGSACVLRAVAKHGSNDPRLTAEVSQGDIRACVALYDIGSDFLRVSTIINSSL